jgi:hypothetical protein
MQEFPDKELFPRLMAFLHAVSARNPFSFNPHLAGALAGIVH